MNKALVIDATGAENVSVTVTIRPLGNVTVLWTAADAAVAVRSKSPSAKPLQYW
jgi:hypothetical protein